MTLEEVLESRIGTSDEYFIFEDQHHSRIGVNPRRSLTLNSASSLQTLRQELGDSFTDRPPVIAGFVGYGISRWLERLPDRHPAMPVPDGKMLFFDEVITLPRDGDQWSVVGSQGVPPQTAETHRPPTTDHRPQWNANCSPAQFLDSVRKAKEAIAAGEAFQIVVSQRWEMECPDSEALALFRALRRINPSPYMFLLKMKECTLVGCSPEMLVRVRDGIVETRPIAGTRPRGENAAEDAAMERELLASEKESAEHLMLVDLGRNDVGRVARPGSVKVTEFRTVERYSDVMHLVSHVKGELREELSPLDALLAAFPAGTVSGAPKIRAMELIDELEFSRRGPYAGAVLFSDSPDSLDSCITIRTILLHENRAYVQAGAGIVFDSDPAFEYEETMNKAAALKRAVEEVNRPVAREP